MFSIILVWGCEMAHIYRWYWFFGVAMALIMVTGCRSSKTYDRKEHTESKTNDADSDVPMREPMGDFDQPLLPLPVVLDPGPLPPAGAPIAIGDGYGGGSQGALQPFDIHHRDDDHEEFGPNGVCGNGVQEVLPNNNSCPFLLYGVTTNGSGVSTLVAFELGAAGFSVVIGEIDPTIATHVTAIDFSPDAILYGVGQNPNNSNASSYFSINCMTGEPTLIAATGLPANAPGTGTKTLTDISFDSFGRLYAYVHETGPNDDQLGYIGTLTGVYHNIGATGIVDIGNGLGGLPFPFDTLYDAGTLLYNLSKATGASTFLDSVGFSPPASNVPFINSLDADFFTEIMYASITQNGGAGPNYIGIFNVVTGGTKFVSNPPLVEPANLTGIAYNQRYEECDPLATQPTLPAGTSCSDTCHIYESNCADGIDNDDNGLIDCADPACANQTCNDHNGCTQTATCIDAVCVGSDPEPCFTGNECAAGFCTSTGDFTFDCGSTPITNTTYGSCTPSSPINECSCSRNPDGSCPSACITNPCNLGSCVDGLCTQIDKTLYPISEGGCLDNVPVLCKVAICDQYTGGQCLYGYEEICDDG
jgi:hypothetical protein